MDQTDLIGIDLGGTKISAVRLDGQGAERFKKRVPTPRNDYGATVRTICDLVEQAKGEAPASIGIGMPGSFTKHGQLQNANSTWLNGKTLGQDLANALAAPVRMANDANCLALSEAHDGAAKGFHTVFGVILGTGCGGGLVVDGTLVNGPNSASGEWGHLPLSEAGQPPRRCWCGRVNCNETWLSGPGLALSFENATGIKTTGEDIATRAAGGDATAGSVVNRYFDDLARGLSLIANVIDPDIFVIGGGLSALPGLYDALPERLKAHIFADAPIVTIRPALHGSDSGVLGAARLWSDPRAGTVNEFHPGS